MYCWCLDGGLAFKVKTHPQHALIWYPLIHIHFFVIKLNIFEFSLKFITQVFFVVILLIKLESIFFFFFFLQLIKVIYVLEHEGMRLHES